MTPERLDKIRNVVDQRFFDLTIILENVHDPHNLGAILRSCDAVGIREIFVVFSDPRLSAANLRLGKRASSGARRWVDVGFFEDLEGCFSEIRQRYSRILAAQPGEENPSLFDLDLKSPVALLFGNEQEGLSEKAVAGSDGCFSIPQVGMIGSLNVSVACAVSIFEAFRQRRTGKTNLSSPGLEEVVQRQALLETYMRLNGEETAFEIRKK